jgi:hypothetical protein
VVLRPGDFLPVATARSRNGRAGIRLPPSAHGRLQVLSIPDDARAERGLSATFIAR